MIPVARPFFDEDEARAVAETLRSGWVTQGPRVKEFEACVAEYVGAKYAVAVSSCTTALHLALLVAGIGLNDEVICPALSFIATANAIRYVGARPVFVDVDPDTYNLDPVLCGKHITAKTKAILLVHQLGLPADRGAFKKLSSRHKITLIEDAACALGSSTKGKKIGSDSALTCFSFHPRKVITTGEGGMITTSSKSHFEKLKLLRHHGMSVNDLDRHKAKTIISERYQLLGYNYRMSDISAAIGICQMKKLDRMIAHRKNLAQKYQEGLADLKAIKLPTVPSDAEWNFQSYMICVAKGCGVSRDRLMQRLLDQGISTRRGVMSIHNESIYKKDFKPRQPLRHSEMVSGQGILLPLYYGMTQKEAAKIIRTIRKEMSR